MADQEQNINSLECDEYHREEDMVNFHCQVYQRRLVSQRRQVSQRRLVSQRRQASRRDPSFVDPQIQHVQGGKERPSGMCLQNEVCVETGKSEEDHRDPNHFRNLPLRLEAFPHLNVGN